MISETPPRSARESRTIGPSFCFLPILIVAFAISLQIPFAYPLDEQSEAVTKRIESLGGSVAFNSVRSQSTSEWLEDNLAVSPDHQPVRAVFLKNSVVSGDVLTELKSLHNLERLYIQNCEVSDEGLANLKLLPNLAWLNLGGTTITETGLKHLKEVDQLKVLVLYETQITDAGLEHLKSMTNLEELYLGYNEITDEGLKHLTGLTSLKRLGLYKTPTTAAGKAMIRTALPNCRIFPSEM